VRLTRWSLAFVLSCGVGVGVPGVINAEVRQTMVECAGFVIPIKALKNPKGAEAQRDTGSRALAAFLGSSDAREFPLPRHGWRRLAETRHRLLFGHDPRWKRDYLSIVLDRQRGSWEPYTWGETRPVRYARDFEFPRLLLADKAVSRRDRTLSLRLDIASGEVGRDRKVDAVNVSAAFSKDEVRILASLKEEHGPVDGTIRLGVGLELPYLLRLPQEIGRRRIVDISRTPGYVIGRGR
jgi:hypothetical protein